MSRKKFCEHEKLMENNDNHKIGVHDLQKDKLNF